MTRKLVSDRPYFFAIRGQCPKSNRSGFHSIMLTPGGHTMSTFLQTPGTIRLLFLVALLFPSATISRAQQDYVGRYNLYTGFSDLSSPGLNIRLAFIFKPR